MLADLPACSLEQGCNAAIAIADHTGWQLDNGPGKSILVFALCRQIALRAAWLIDQLARPPFTDAMPFTSMAYRTAAVVPGLEVSRGNVLQHQLVQA